MPCAHLYLLIDLGVGIHAGTAICESAEFRRRSAPMLATPDAMRFRSRGAPGGKPLMKMVVIQAATGTINEMQRIKTAKPDMACASGTPVPCK